MKTGRLNYKQEQSKMDKIYIKLTPNNKRSAPNHPSYVAPINPKSPPGKEWRIGVKIGDNWYNQAAFDEVAENGEPTGNLTVQLTPNDSAKSSSSGGSGTPAYAPKPFAKQQSYGNNKPQRW